jgi:hypothetical protein
MGPERRLRLSHFIAARVRMISRSAHVICCEAALPAPPLCLCQAQRWSRRTHNTKGTSIFVRRL